MSFREVSRIFFALNTAPPSPLSFFGLTALEILPFFFFVKYVPAR